MKLAPLCRGDAGGETLSAVPRAPLRHGGAVQIDPGLTALEGS